MGLYDAVRKEQPRRRFHPLWAAALVFAVALVTVLGLVISKPQRDHDRFVQCMSEISSNSMLLLSLQRALLGEVHASLRQASIEADPALQTIRLRFEYDGEPSG